MIKKLFCITLLLIISNHLVNAQNLYFKTEVEVIANSKAASNLFAQGNTVDFFKLLKKYWPLPENEIDNLEQKTIKSINLIKERYGEIIGAVKLKEQRLGDFSFKETYFVRYKFSCVRLTYVYYRNNSGWFIHSFKWDDQWIEEFN